MFQAALGGAVLFNPEREADPVAVASVWPCSFLPYSIIGPFAGALLTGGTAGGCSGRRT